MTKQDILDTLLLLSALESWGFSQDKMLPDYLHENLASIINRLSEELLKPASTNSCQHQWGCVNDGKHGHEEEWKCVHCGEREYR